jgi:hypothetical protein
MGVSLGESYIYGFESPASQWPGALGESWILSLFPHLHRGAHLCPRGTERA